MSASFFTFENFHKSKINFSLKSVIVTTVIISLQCKETNETVLFTLLLQKIVEKSNKENLKVIKNALPSRSGNPKSFKKES